MGGQDIYKGKPKESVPSENNTNGLLRCMHLRKPHARKQQRQKIYVININAQM